MVQTAEGALNEVHAILQRVRELAVEYNNGTLSSADQAEITVEITQLSAEVARIATRRQFNGIDLLSGSVPVTFQVGANAGETIILSGANRAACGLRVVVGRRIGGDAGVGAAVGVGDHHAACRRS